MTTKNLFKTGWLTLTGVVLMLALGGCSRTPAAGAAPTTPAEDALTALFTPLGTLTPTIPPTETPVPAADTIPVVVGTESTTPVGGEGTRTGQLPVYYFAHRPEIDGNWSEWQKVEHALNVIVYGEKNWDGREDLSGAFKLGWDEKNFYVVVKVYDDRYGQTAQGENIENGDSVEVLLDTDLQSDFSSDSLNADDYQIGISAGYLKPEGDKEAYLWFPARQAGSLPDVQIGSTDASGLWRVEAAIPWKAVGVTPVSGMRLGFALRVIDNDKEDAAIQQTIVSHNLVRVSDPTSWVEIVLK